MDADSNSEGAQPTIDPTRTIQISEATPGATLGPYKLIRQLGEGGMGVVYHAQQLQPLRRDVALKVIKPGMDSKQVIARFESERQALALMDHANIARVFDAGTTSAGLPYFVMELVDGVPITRYCDSKRLTIRERIELFIPVCQAIQHAHQKGIIHRDIKPSNILVAEQEGKPAPKVIDFGLAKALGQQMNDATVLTNLGMVVGTFSYMSPEQAEIGRHDIDTRSDVYSLGAVLYELLTGTTPLERMEKASYVEVLQRIREHETQWPSVRVRQSAELKNTAEVRGSDAARLPKLLDRELDWIAMKALEKHRTQRYETVNALVRDLERYLAGEPVEASPPSTTYRLRKFVRRHRLALAVAAAFTSLLLVGVIVSTWEAVRARRAEQAALSADAEARAVNEFLQNDVLAQASATTQAAPNTKPDPDLKVRTALDRAAARIEGKFAGQPLVEASIRQTIGQTYYDLGLFEEGQRQAERALELRRRLLGETHPATLASMIQVAQLHQRQGKYALAEPLYMRIVELRRRVLGTEHPDTLASIHDLAWLYNDEGKYEQSETLYNEVITIRRRLLGDDHKETLNAKSDLALLYVYQGKYAQAEPILAQVAPVLQRVLGEEHPDTLVALVDLAFVYTSQGKYAQAEPLVTQALAVRRRVLGEEHPDTLTAMQLLARLYVYQGKYAQADPLISKALEVRRRVLGADHPETVGMMNEMAELRRRQGQFAQAEELLIPILAVRRRVLGEAHPDTLRTFVYLGRVRLQEHNYPQAELALRDTLIAYERTSPGAWQRYSCQSMLGASLEGQKKFADAEPHILGGYEGMTARQAAIPAGNRAELSDAGERIVQLYEDWGKPEKAAEWRQKLQQTKLTSSSERP